MSKIHYTRFLVTSPFPTSWQQISVMEFGDGLLPAPTCYRLVIYVAHLLLGSRQLVTDLLRGNWCNWFWFLQVDFCKYRFVATWHVCVFLCF